MKYPTLSDVARFAGFRPSRVDDVPEHCWCGSRLDPEGQCPVHGDPDESAKEERADSIRDNLSDE